MISFESVLLGVTVTPSTSKSSTTTSESAFMVKFGLDVHPGEILRQQMEELGLSANALAARIDVPANRVSAILRGTRGITADTALRFGRFFSQTPEFWMNLQRTYDLVIAEREIGKELKRIRRAS